MNPSSDVPAVAFVIDRLGQTYFRTFARLGSLKASRVALIRPQHVEGLMDLMLASSESDFLIDAHGDQNGLFLKLAERSRIDATGASLNMLLRVATARERVRQAGTDLSRWRDVIRRLGPEARVSSLGAARAAVQRYIHAYARALGLTEAQMNRLIRKMYQLQGREIREIAFRACSAGKKWETLQSFRHFFRSKIVGAPDVRTGIAMVTPGVGAGRVARLLRAHPRARVFTLPAGRLALRIENPRGVQVRTWCAADSWKTVTQWVGRFIMTGARYNPRNFPVHFLWTDSRALPLEDEYWNHMKYSTHIWTPPPLGITGGQPNIWDRALQTR